MNVFISADIEGVGGVMGWHQGDPTGRDYKLACQWMTAEVNAAIEGCLAAGATSIVVKDSHNEANNIELDKLHPAAELISGWGPLGSMVEGIDEQFDALVLIGYHARSSSVRGTLAHTWSSIILDLQLNGRSMGEAAWAAAFAGHYKVPLAMVTGDDRLKGQLDEELPPGFHYVITKTAMAYKAARMRPIEEVRSEIRETATAALSDVEALPVFEPELPATMTLRFRHWEKLTDLEAVPNVERIDANTVQVQVNSIIEAQKYFMTLVRLARQG
jgi:D-amino peptidase